MALILLVLGCDRHDGKDSEVPGIEGSLDFGVVAAGTTSTRAIRVTAMDASASTSADGLSIRTVEEGGSSLILVTCDPEALTAESGSIDVGDESFDWSCSLGDARPEPLREIALADARSLPETEMGDAEISAASRLIPVSRSGDLFLTDAGAGRLWRQNSLYSFGSWGVWGIQDEETEPDWKPAPSCFEDGKSSHQNGTCTGDERNEDGEIPDGYSFYHGGFIDGLPGVADAVDVPGPDVVVATGDDGEGWVAVIDASLDERLGDEESYSYFRLVRPIDADGLPTGLRVAVNGANAVAVAPDGSLFRITNLDTPSPDLAGDGSVGGAVQGWASDSSGALVFADGHWLRVADTVTPLPDCDAWGLADELAPVYASSDGTRLWAYFGDGLLGWRLLDGSDGGFQIVDNVSGLVADNLGIAYVLVGTDLRVVDAGGAPDSGTTLADVPIAFGGDTLPHDVYVAYGAGSAGCDGALDSVCEDGTHPAVVHSFYAVAGLEKAVSTGHPMNLFFAPVVETPKDEAVDGDFSKGNAICEPAPDGVDADIYAACCAMERSSMRVKENLDYFTGVWGKTFILGINPTWLRQARSCLALDDTTSQERGRDAIRLFSDYIGMMEFSRWTHTGLTDPEFDTASAYYINALFGSGAWTPPVDTQDEYNMLHDGLAAMYDYSDLGEMDGVPFTDYELPGIQAGAGNGFDGWVMVDEGWTDGSWIEGIRDGGDGLDAFYFASAGSMPEIGLYGYRKKENFPLPMDKRACAFEMGTDPSDWWEGGESGMVYIGGMNWAINTVGDIAAAGAFRETVIWGTSVDEQDWIGSRRYIRRTLASAAPDDVKSWYVHLYDLSNNDGDFQNASDVTPEKDINVEGIAAIDEELVTPGYAVWSNLSVVVDEYQASRP